jgi:hypothetical protein
MDFGLPQGWEGRVVTRQFGGLCLNLPARQDQICFKLYAVVDRGPNDKHFEDLKKLNPTAEELVFAARWTVTHDPSEACRPPRSMGMKATSSLSMTWANWCPGWMAHHAHLVATG